MEFKSDQLFSMFVMRLNPMEKASSFFVNHLHYKISNPINNVNNIPNLLTHHLPWTPWKWVYLILSSQQLHLASSIGCIELPCFRIARHKLQSSWPCNRLGHIHDRPWSIFAHTLHDRTSSTHLKIVIRLHLLDEIKSGRKSINGHLEQINLIPSLLTKKIIFMDIIITKQCPQFEI
jgi:hypothetical protein